MLVSLSRRVSFAEPKLTSALVVSLPPRTYHNEIVPRDRHTESILVLVKQLRHVGPRRRTAFIVQPSGHCMYGTECLRQEIPRRATGRDPVI